MALRRFSSERPRLGDFAARLVQVGPLERSAFIDRVRHRRADLSLPGVAGARFRRRAPPDVYQLARLARADEIADGTEVVAEVILAPIGGPIRPADERRVRKKDDAARAHVLNIRVNYRSGFLRDRVLDPRGRLSPLPIYLRQADRLKCRERSLANVNRCNSDRVRDHLAEALLAQGEDSK